MWLVTVWLRPLLLVADSTTSTSAVCWPRCRRFEAAAAAPDYGLAEAALATTAKGAAGAKTYFYRAKRCRLWFCPVSAADFAGGNQLPEQPGLCHGFFTGRHRHAQHAAHLAQPVGAGVDRLERAPMFCRTKSANKFTAALAASCTSGHPAQH